MASGRAARLLRTARLRAGISQVELARRAGVPRSVVNAYERGTRDPGADALVRLLSAAGTEIRLGRTVPVDVERNARVLEQVLDLAEQLPARRKARLSRSPLAGRLA